jgi:hypothetical protein
MKQKPNVTTRNTKRLNIHLIPTQRQYLSPQFVAESRMAVYRVQQYIDTRFSTKILFTNYLGAKARVALYDKLTVAHTVTIFVFKKTGQKLSFLGK